MQVDNVHITAQENLSDVRMLILGPPGAPHSMSTRVTRTYACTCWLPGSMSAHDPTFCFPKLYPMISFFHVGAWFVLAYRHAQSCVSKTSRRDGTGPQAATRAACHRHPLSCDSTLSVPYQLNAVCLADLCALLTQVRLLRSRSADLAGSLGQAHEMTTSFTTWS